MAVKKFNTRTPGFFIAWVILFLSLANNAAGSIHHYFKKSPTAFAALVFDWNGSATTWASSGAWAEAGGTGDYPGSGGRTTDVVRFGVTGSSYTNQPTLSTAINIASIEFGGGIEKTGTDLTVTGVILTAGTVTQDINTTTSSNTIFDYLQGTGTVTCTTINVGSGTNINGTFNFLLSDVATLNVSGNVVIISNVNKQNGCGFRLENGNMYLAGQVIFTSLSGITASNASYFTINTVAQAGGNTTPHLYLSNVNPLGAIPTPHASVNFYGDHGGSDIVSYTAPNPIIYTTSMPGFGSGGGTIDTTKAIYDFLTIQGSGTANIGTTTLGALKVSGDFTTASPATLNTSGGTNTTVGGNWINSSTVTGGSGTTAISGNITNSGALTLGTGSTDVGGNLANTATFNAGAGNIQVDASVTNSSALTLAAGDFTVEGNYTNGAGGVFTAGTGALNFSGSSAQALVDNSTTGTKLNNVNFSGGGTKTLSGTGSFATSSSGVLTMAASTLLQTGGILTLNSASTGSATVAGIPSTSSITGAVNVQRYISGGSNSYRSYRLLSSAVYTASASSNYYYSLGYLTLFAPVTGSLGTGGGLSKTGNPSMYLYRDNVAFTNSTFNTGNFRGVKKINNAPLYNIGVDFDGTFSLHAGTGFMFFYRGNLTNIATKYTTTTSAEAGLFSSTGTLNQQAVTVVNWYTQLATLQLSTVTGNAGYSGYNLVGNPYASSIDWATFSTSSSTAGIYGPGVGTAIYIFNDVLKVYATYDGGASTNGGSNIIPSGQGFFVKAIAAGASLTFNEAAKTNAQLTGPTQTTGTTILLNAMPVTSLQPQYLRLQLAKDSVNTDETYIGFKPDAQTQYLINEDALYMQGMGEVSFASISSDNVPLAINRLPYPKQQPLTINLKTMATADGLYTLNMTQMVAIPTLYKVWLMDAYKKDSLDMRQNKTYAFDVALADTNSFGSKRFSLVIRQDPALGIHLLNFTAIKATGGAQLTWTTENEQDYTNFTVQRSSDGGLNFGALGSIASGSLGKYSFLDSAPPVAADEYRLMITDLNGVTSYSNIVTLSYGNGLNPTVANIIIYPNPSAAVINVTINQATGQQPVISSIAATGLSAFTPTSQTVAGSPSFSIKIVNLTGIVIQTAAINQNTWQSNTSALLPGPYIIWVFDNRNNKLVGTGTFVKL